ncbi:hypothetical protein B9Z55_014876 [Caenorhabditis nigoni]|uniref:C2H2-type domain-containing protein n=1 Tax=Caenorhabditis nigoni TaxID=1611254 RepID=A0A2G5U7T1_9PELO|nr:hypothetical protein B9Z55_014876 [Caenorhabditis nigoni]
MRDIIKCPKCNFQCKRSYSVGRHLLAIHDATEEDIEAFRAQLVASRALKRHGGGAWKCDKCQKLFASQRSLDSHIKKEHTKLLDPSDISLFPDDSSTSSPPPKIWKNSREEESCTSWMIRSKYSKENEFTNYYNCRHDGHYESVVQKLDKPKSIKLTGEYHCPAFLKSTKNEETGKITVVGFHGHYGHDLKNAWRSLNEREISIIIRMMTDGFSNSQIIKKCEKFPPENRLSYIIHDDLRYLRKKYNLQEGVLDENDLASVKKRVERGWKEDGILMFQEPDELGAGLRLVLMTPSQKELCLKYHHRGIVIDDTHNTTKYGIKLTTLMVLNGFDRAIPVAFLLSSSCTSDDCAALFQCVKNEIPTFHPQWFMSDEANAFWNGYNTIFPNNKSQRLWCRWHVLRALEKNCDEMLTKESSADVKKTISELIREPDRVKFDRGILSLLEFLEKDGTRGQKYAEYLRSYYLKHVEVWANCYRSKTPFHTSMYSENWHSALKKDLLHRKTNIRLDELIQVLLDGFQWVIRRLAKQMERQLKKACPRRNANLKNCQLAIDQQDHYIVTRNQNGDLELMKKESGDVYVVRDDLGCACFSEENVHCLCGACAYRFTCSCQVQLGGICCKHIHLAIRHCQENQSMEEAEDEAVPFRNFDVPGPGPQYFDVSDFLDVPVREESEKMYNLFSQSIDNLAQKMRMIKKKPGNEETMQKVLELIQQANDLFPKGKAPTLVSRRDSQGARKSARETMHTLPRRQKRHPQYSKKRGTRIASKHDPSICNVCNLRDPILPLDMNEIEPDALDTDWRRCVSCKLPVHFLCSSGSCPSCGDNFENYQPSDSEVDQVSSDSSDEMP